MTNKIIINPQDQITCPHCDTSFALRDAIAHQLIEQHEEEYAAMLTTEREQLQQSLVAQATKDASKTYQSQLSDLKGQLKDSQDAEKSFQKQIALTKKKTESQVRQELLVESQSMKDDLAEKDAQLDTFRQQELQLRKEKKAIELQQKNLEIDVARKLDEERAIIRSQVAQEHKLKEAELKKKIDDASKVNDELTRKLEQGSQQLQGEVLELELENTLEQSYLFDLIDPVKKGVNGADVIQTVRLRSGSVCGKIIWETKRTANWSNAWISKLKADVQSVAGDIGVLVTSAFPADVSEPLVLKDGIWLVKPNLAKGLSEALRTVLIESHRQKIISVGKNEQMEALYDYICSNQFAQRVRAVVDSQEQMRVDLDKEKAAMQRMWKKRETQINGISTQMMAVCGELQGLAQGGMPQLDGIGALTMENV